MKKLIFTVLKIIEITILITVEYGIVIIYGKMGIYKLYEKIPDHILYLFAILGILFLIWFVINVFADFIKINKLFTDMIYKKIKNR